MNHYISPQQTVSKKNKLAMTLKGPNTKSQILKVVSLKLLSIPTLPLDIVQHSIPNPLVEPTKDPQKYHSPEI